MLSTGEKSDRAEFEETFLQQFFAIWGIAIMEVLSQAGNRSHNSFTVKKNDSAKKGGNKPLGGIAK